ncbi:hypothetical protein GCM10011581_27960 [Saccharopolyspora subtropica]|uniref:Tetratricopeptide repeat protein n=1 Tax=Saccharopolyspora thermophila TaxID=89367 RepID=A0A917JXQ9_9PSEU|nr:hypothetical protein GCM10011581_27960 [Saccharopolyspora subtropica]
MRDQLFATYRRGDEPAFLRLCQQNADVVVRCFDEWAVVPEEIRHDQQAVGTWGRTLVAIAQVLAALGHPGPMRRILPTGPENPLHRWADAYRRAQQRSELGEFAASSERLRALLADMAGASGSAVDDLRAKILGLLGTNDLKQGRLADAIRYTEQALRQCEANGDAEGVRIYTENLDAALVAKAVEDRTPAAAQLVRAREAIAFAQHLSDTGRHQASNDVLDRLRGELDGDHAGARYLGKVHGLIGLNHFRLGDLAAARRHTERAIAECRRRADPVGVRIYTANLATIDAQDR